MSTPSPQRKPIDDPSACAECGRLRARYASATDKREWTKSDLIAAALSHDESAMKATQFAKDEAVQEWEAALAALQEHLGSHA